MRHRSLLFGAIGHALLIGTAMAQCDPQQTQRLLPSDPSEYARFGWAGAVEGDTAIIGAFFDDPTDSAYVFRKDGGGDWIETQKLVPSDGAESFGVSVAMENGTAIIGAWVADGNEARSGAAYVFRPDGNGNWVEVQKIWASDGGDLHRFGGSIAISGDIAIIGAEWDDDRDERAGAAYIFRNDDGNWVEIDKVIGSAVLANHHFGEVVDVSGDTAIVGADWENGFARGSAYIFRDDGAGNWVEIDRLLASDGEQGDFFGSAVAILGGLAVVGAEEGEMTDGKPSGSAYIFRDNGADWIEIDKVVPSDPLSNDGFGTGPDGVAIVDDATIIVGADGADGNELRAGAAYVFHDDAGDWVETHKIFASDGTRGDDVGRSVSVDGGTLILGAARDDLNGSWSGSAYVFDLGCGCAADIDGDGDLDAEDFFAYLDLFASGDDGADIDGDGDIDAEDFFGYLDLFAQGC